MSKKLESATQISNKILSPKIDIVFQALFGEVGSEKITTNLLETILQEKIEEIDLSKNTILRREYEHDKMGVLDVFAKINGTENCDIELQVSKKSELIERLLFYWARIYTRQINEGNEYAVLNRSIVILICDYGLEGLKDLGTSGILEGKIEDFQNLPYHTEWKIIEKDLRKIILTDKLEIHIISLKKAKEKQGQEVSDKLLDWLNFLENPKSKEVLEKMEENEALKEAGKKLDNLSDDEDMQRLADYRWSIAWRERTVREAGLIEGKKAGREEGREEGRKENKLEVAKKMLEKGIELETIIEITGLTKDEILNIR